MMASALFAQEITVYRITPEGRYQSLRGEPGMAFDETRGSFYRDITIRTFFLETQRLGYIPSDITYEDFLSMTIEEQEALLLQPLLIPDCSSTFITDECLEFQYTPAKVHPSKGGVVIDLSYKCPEKYGWEKMSGVGKMLTSPGEPPCKEAVKSQQ